MAVLVDTSGVYAGISSRDPNHDQAVASWERLLGGPGPLITHSLIEVESVALIQARIGVEAVEAFRDHILPLLEVVEVSRDHRRQALAAMVADRRRELSLVDRVSFALMRELGLREAFAFDRHFAHAGFALVD